MKPKRSVRPAKPKKPASPRARRRSPAKAPSPPAATQAISTILVPIDFSVHSKNALSYAVLIARKFGASLHLMYVVEPTIYPADLGFGQVVLPGVEDELREKGEVELEALIAKEIGSQVAATCAVRTGNPHQEILREADEKKVDLIIVATHGHSGMEHMLFGSTADRVVKHAKCPVLTVRESTN